MSYSNDDDTTLFWEALSKGIESFWFVCFKMSFTPHMVDDVTKKKLKISKGNHKP